MIALAKKPRKMATDPPRVRRLRPSQVDDLGETIMVLTREIWVLTDRLASLESILERKGIVVDEEIERFQPTEAQDARLKARREALLAAVASALRGLDY